MAKLDACSVEVPNVEYCLKILRKLLAVLPKTTVGRPDVKAIVARRKDAEKAIDYLAYMFSPDAKNVPMSPCADDSRVPRPSPMKARVKKVKARKVMLRAMASCADDSRVPRS